MKNLTNLINLMNLINFLPFHVSHFKVILDVFKIKKDNNDYLKGNNARYSDLCGEIS